MAQAPRLPARVQPLALGALCFLAHPPTPWIVGKAFACPPALPHSPPLELGLRQSLSQLCVSCVSAVCQLCASWEPAGSQLCLGSSPAPLPPSPHSPPPQAPAFRWYEGPCPGAWPTLRGWAGHGLPLKAGLGACWLCSPARRSVPPHPGASCRPLLTHWAGGAQGPLPQNLSAKAVLEPVGGGCDGEGHGGNGGWDGVCSVRSQA